MSNYLFYETKSSGLLNTILCGVTSGDRMKQNGVNNKTKLEFNWKAP